MKPTTFLCVAALILMAGCAKQNGGNLDAANGQSVEEWVDTLQSSPEPPQAYHSKSQSNWTGWNKFWFASAIGGQAADALTTISGTDDGKCKEVNPVFGENPSSGAIIGIKALITGGAIWIVESIYKDNPRQQEYRNWIYGALAVSGIGAAAWNTSQDCE